MKTYFAIQFGCPAALPSSNIKGSIITEITSEARPVRQRVQQKLENEGFKGYIRVIEKSNFEKKYTNHSHNYFV